MGRSSLWPFDYLWSAQLLGRPGATSLHGTQFVKAVAAGNMSTMHRSMAEMLATILQLNAPNKLAQHFWKECEVYYETLFYNVIH